ncbi:MAG: MBL fold metallo-hydrolase [Chitinophagaceae bacterium]|nr:MBL fold metallo-hydrolase [Chitinophagaceae bacterium]
MKIIPLSEGRFTIDATKHFIPFTESEHSLKERPSGSLLVEIQPFVVITSKDILLLDAGLGFYKDGRLQLHHNLINAGINPSEVTKVLMSHLHKDHAGGLSLNTDGNEYKLAFPQAIYYVQQAELAFAFEKKSSSFDTNDLECLRQTDKVQLLSGNGFIDGYIEYKLSGAHSPHHQVFWIREDDETVFYGGDEAPQLQQMKHRFIAKYDYEGKKAMELRQQWWQQGEKGKWSFLFYHDVRHPVWQFI